MTAVILVGSLVGAACGASRASDGALRCDVARAADGRSGVIDCAPVGAPTSASPSSGRPEPFGTKQPEDEKHPADDD